MTVSDTVSPSTKGGGITSSAPSKSYTGKCVAYCRTRSNSIVLNSVLCKQTNIWLVLFCTTRPSLCIHWKPGHHDKQQYPYMPWFWTAAQSLTCRTLMYFNDDCFQWRRLHGAREGRGARAPHFYIWLDTGAPWVEEQQTRNWLNCTDHHESAHQ